MSNRVVTKEQFLLALSCITRGWYSNHDGDGGAPTIGERFRMEEGMEVHRRARALFENGIYAGNDARTAELMADAHAMTVFEAEAREDGYVARADILDREGTGWHLIEVKSNTNDDESLVDDLAYTAMVLGLAGVPLTRCSLWLMSAEYLLGMSDGAMFVEVDHTDEVLARISEWQPQLFEIRDSVRNVSRPDPSLIWECRKCERFANECLCAGVTNHIFNLPRISEKKFNELTAMSVSVIEDIPVDYELTANQETVRAAIRSGQPVVSDELSELLGEVQWPARYLDFETMATAIPLYPDVAPHEQVVTQYSIHCCSTIGEVAEHVEFLADPSRDCRRELAERLIEDLGEQGSIVVYSSFESRILNGLASRFPDLAKSLTQCVGRLFDLEAVIKKAYCHPEFGGRTSIKVTLPVLVPMMSYADMSIGDGDTAMAQFARMAQGKCDEDETTNIRKQLLEYCGLDTLAMVRLHEQLNAQSVG